MLLIAHVAFMRSSRSIIYCPFPNLACIENDIMMVVAEYIGDVEFLAEG
jgi:hypothetical protein